MAASGNERLDLLVNASATGTDAIAQIGGRYVLTGTGTFGGATLQIQMLAPDNSTYINLANGSFTAAPIGVAMDLPQGAHVRATLTGGAPSGFYVSLARAQQG